MFGQEVCSNLIYSKFVMPFIHSGETAFQLYQPAAFTEVSITFQPGTKLNSNAPHAAVITMVAALTRQCFEDFECTTCTGPPVAFSCSPCEHGQHYRQQSKAQFGLDEDHMAAFRGLKILQETGRASLIESFIQSPSHPFLGTLFNNWTDV